MCVLKYNWISICTLYLQITQKYSNGKSLYLLLYRFILYCGQKRKLHQLYTPNLEISLIFIRIRYQMFNSSGVARAVLQTALLPTIYFPNLPHCCALPHPLIVQISIWGRKKVEYRLWLAKVGLMDLWQRAWQCSTGKISRGPKLHTGHVYMSTQ